MILVDLNVVLDVLQKRQPHHRASATVLSEAVTGRAAACLPAHAFTTLHYLIKRYQSARKANDVIDWLLRSFSVASTTRTELLRAQRLGWPDFEDAVVAAAAESAGCEHIITRNLRDFRRSPVPALSPEEYLLERGPVDRKPEQ